MIDEFDRFQYATRQFERRKFTSAATELEAILDSEEGRGRADVRELLMRSYFHSAQLRKAEDMARARLEENPVDAYSLVVLGRSLYRQRRYEEAEQFLRQAEAFGVPTV